MTTIITPASLDAAVAELGGLGELLTATEWHRAAIVATFVRLGAGRGRNVDSGISPVEFASRGITGLSSHSTVSHYVQCWLDHHDGVYPIAGSRVALPMTVWPPQKRNKGTRVTEPAVTRRLVEDEDFAREVLTEAILTSPVVASICRDALAERHPVVPAERSESSGPEMITDAKVVRHGSYLVRALAAVEDGAYEPGPQAALILAIVRPRHDWDADLAALTGGA